MMSVQIRRALAADAPRCGEILFRASEDFANRHHFARDYPTLEGATQYAEYVITHPCIYGVVAESDGELVGLNFLKELNTIRGVGPLAVDPDAQSHGVGRALMDAVLDRAAGAPGVRLVQVGYHLTSLTLYASLGFSVREPIAWMQGRPEPVSLPSGVVVRPLTESDLEQAEALSLRVHGIDRTPELRNAGTQPLVLTRDSRVVAYLSDAAFGKLGHAVAEMLEDLQMLIATAAAARQSDVGFLVPMRQDALFRWCLQQRMRVVKPMTLMSTGFYQEPRGAYLPSVQY